MGLPYGFLGDIAARTHRETRDHWDSSHQRWFAAQAYPHGLGSAPPLPSVAVAGYASMFSYDAVAWRNAVVALFRHRHRAHYYVVGAAATAWRPVRTVCDSTWAYEYELCIGAGVGRCMVKRARCPDTKFFSDNRRIVCRRRENGG